MLTPDYIKAMPNNVVDMFEKLEAQMLGEISETLRASIEKQSKGILSATSDYKLQVLEDIGYSSRDLNRMIGDVTDSSISETNRILESSTQTSYANDKTLYERGGKRLPLNPDPKLKDYLKAVKKQTKGELKNITNSIGIAKNGKNMDISHFYRDTLDYASIQLGSGAYTIDQVIKQATNSLIDSGIRTIDYESGRSYQIDGAVRRAILTSSGQITGIMSEQNADLMGQDLMEVSGHAGARPSHQDFEGQVISRSGKNKNYLSPSDIGYGEGWGFKGYNCRHDWYPYFEGLSKPMYMEENLPDFDYKGETYTHYEATQKQRAMERGIKKTKREIDVYKGAKLKNDLLASRVKLKRQQEEYRNFSKISGIRAKPNRLRLFSGTGKTKEVAPAPLYSDVKEVFKSFSLKKIDKDFARDIEKRFLDLQNTYPIGEGELIVRTLKPNGVFGYSSTGMNYTTRKGKKYVTHVDEIVLNHEYFYNRETKRHYSLETYRVRGSKLRSELGTVDHEYAHAIDNAYKRAKNKKYEKHIQYFKNPVLREPSDEYFENIKGFIEYQTKKDYISKEIYSEMQKAYGLDNKDFETVVKNELGTYAITDEKEFLAEGFSTFRLIEEEEKTEFVKLFQSIFNRKFDEVLR